MAGAFGSIAVLMIFVAAMVSFGVQMGMLDKPVTRRCAACGRLRHRGICPCSARNP